LTAKKQWAAKEVVGTATEAAGNKEVVGSYIIMWYLSSSDVGGFRWMELKIKNYTLVYESLFAQIIIMTASACNVRVHSMKSWGRMSL
jgi:hypothetical protein